jgi:hypothetical protein
MNMSMDWRLGFGMAVWLAACCGGLLQAAEEPASDAPAASPRQETDGVPPEDERVVPAPKLPDPEGAKKLPDPDAVWVDMKNRQVLVDGHVSLREGYLEMFACIVGTKEHESVIAVRTRAATVHAALLAVGAVDGEPVQFQPRFRPPTGTEIDVEVHWVDEQGEWQQARAQDWILEVKTKKPMTQPWVFAGSIMMKDEETGKEYYMAEGGELVCVSNFATATLDIPVESTASDAGLSFEANTEAIPPLGLPVRMVLKPNLEKDKQRRDKKGAAPADTVVPTAK